MNPDNQSILQAILGTGAADPTTTFNTGLVGSNNQPGGQLPNMQGPLDQLPNYMGTIQNMFGGAGGQQQPSPAMSSMGSNFPQSQTRHTPGRDSWSSGIGLDPGAISRNINLG